MPTRKKKTKKRTYKKLRPGTIFYGGGAIFEVLPDGRKKERKDLTPDSPPSRWKPKYQNTQRKKATRKKATRKKATRKKTTARRKKTSKRTRRK